MINKLKERGYEIKHGKYTAVKPPFGQRFIRIERIGDEYSRAGLEERISKRDEAKNSILVMRENADAFKKPFCNNVLETMNIVSTFRYTPKKHIPEKIYSYTNDVTIDHLSACISLINEYDIHSSENLYRIADELQKQIADCSDNDEKLKLKIEFYSIQSLISTYERISKGSFIDDLIKEQQEREKDSERTQTEDTTYQTPQMKTSNNTAPRKM